jgi:N-methylhydantoinase B
MPATGEPERPAHEYLVARDDGDERVLACRRCHTRLSGYRGNFKLGLLADESPLELLPLADPEPQALTDDVFVVRRFCCPGCHTLLEVEVCRVGDDLTTPLRLA